MIKHSLAVIALYVLPLLLAGIGIIMPDDTSIKICIAYGCFIMAGLILCWAIFKDIKKYLQRNKNNKTKANIKQKKGDPSETLSPVAIDILRVIAAMLSPFGNNRQEATINEIALSETFGISHQQTKHLLELLGRAKMLEINDMGIYGIKHKGRKLLNEKKKLP